MTPHSVAGITGFEIGKYEITYSLWTNVRDWALANGYVFSTNTVGRMGGSDLGGSFTPEHPVTEVCWPDVIVWCNALSVMRGYSPVYYENLQSTNYITNAIEFSPDNYTASCVHWTNTGYRLPTEAEWEYAARRKFDGTLQEGDKPSGYLGPETLEGTNILNQWGPYCWYSDNSSGSTQAVGTTQYPNQMGLYDMSGNVAEWCWDWKNGDYDESSEYTGQDPTGISEGGDMKQRVVRGGAAFGSTYGFAYNQQTANRDSLAGSIEISSELSSSVGFRVVRRP